jgi:hypothetical protein
MNRLWKALLDFISSAKLALVLVALIILFAFAGVILPQQDRVNANDLAIWQQQHKSITDIALPIGLFHVFTSWPFMILVIVLAINTLSCTIIRFKKQGGIKAFSGPEAIPSLGFFLLHISIIILLAACFVSSAGKLDGYIILSEGQYFLEDHDGYRRLVEGPLRPEKHKQFRLRLSDIDIKYEKNKYQTEIVAKFDIMEDGEKIDEKTAMVNHPLKLQGVSITIDETGFSPDIIITEEKRRVAILRSFVALKTFKENGNRRYRDFLPLPFLKNKVVLEFLPDYEMKDGKPIKISEKADKPMIIAQTWDPNDNIIEEKYMELGGKVILGDYNYQFIGHRQWASFKVVDDPGYPLVCFSLWLGLIALIMRYLQEIKSLLSGSNDI